MCHLVTVFVCLATPFHFIFSPSPDAGAIVELGTCGSEAWLKTTLTKSLRGLIHSVAQTDCGSSE